MTRKYNISKQFAVPDGSRRTSVSDPADFEAAITATGFGKYNLLLILIVIPSGWSFFFGITSMSYLFPAAQCDLDLGLDDKGLLNAMTYIGMISSGVTWGFLFDILGRKKLAMIGFLIDGVVVILSSFSQTKTVLLLSRFFGGFIINGPFSALTSYISEFHCAKYRARMQLVVGTIVNLGGISLPLLAWTILPRDFHFQLFNTIEYHSWNIYLLICSIPSVTSAIIFMFMPESPKFLMSMGQNDKALTVFRQVYSANAGKPLKHYPINELIDEIKLQQNSPAQYGGKITANRSTRTALREGWQQVKPLFFPPHLGHVVLMCSIQTLAAMGLNTLRLWLPQIFQVMNDYQHLHDGSSTDLCTMLELIGHSNVTSDQCTVNLNNSSVYINSIIVATVSVCSYLIAGYLINITGKKSLMISLDLISGLSAIAIYFSSNAIFVVSLSAVFIASTSVSMNIILAVIIDLFPTSLRTMSLSMAMMCGRIGVMSGNLLFPILLRTGCAPPFFSVASVIIGCAVLVLFLPKTDLKALD